MLLAECCVLVSTLDTDWLSFCPKQQHPAGAVGLHMPTIHVHGFWCCWMHVPDRLACSKSKWPASDSSGLKGSLPTVA